jgi:hypothetical protein
MDVGYRLNHLNYIFLSYFYLFRLKLYDLTKQRQEGMGEETMYFSEPHQWIIKVLLEG